MPNDAYTPQGWPITHTYTYGVLGTTVINSPQIETPEDKARRIGVPVIPKMHQSQPNYDPNPVVSICGECGLELHLVMHYVCGNSRCPCGLGGIQCKAQLLTE